MSRQKLCRRIVIFNCLVAFLLLFSVPSFASLYVSTSVSVDPTYYIEDENGGKVYTYLPQNTDSAQATDATGTDSAGKIYSSSSVFGSSSYDVAIADAWASYTSLGIYTYSYDYYAASAYAEAAASLSSLWTVTGTGLADGTSGYLLITLLVEGSLYDSGDTTENALTIALINKTLNADNTVGITSLEDGSTEVTLQLAFVYGEDNEIELVLTGSSSSTFGTAELDLWNTAEIESLAFYDSDGSLLDSVILTTASGTAYTVLNGASTSVPEPATMLLFGTGLLGICMVRRKLGRLAKK